MDAGSLAVRNVVNGAEAVLPESVPGAWPQLDRDALLGLAGDFVRLVGPHTEADDAALVVQFLVAFGSAIGRNAHRVADAARHSTNLFCVLVGATSRGRKGSAWARVRRLYEKVDPLWAVNCIAGGLSSGEGLIHAVRNPVTRHEAIREKGGHVTGYQDVETDAGVSDKRVLDFEPEFASVLRVAVRQGNTISTTIRQAWDGGELHTLTRNNPLRATDPHISLIGHITVAELLRSLDSTEAASGFANRFLWVLVRRSKSLPFGGNPDTQSMAALADAVAQVFEFAKNANEIDFDAEARDAFVAVYPKLTAERPGLLGAITARAEAQVLRLALVYALLDCSRLISIEHLIAALSLWAYCERSAEYIFGDRLGDPDADAILNALRVKPAGLTRTEISDLFARNLSAARIDRALVTLLKANLARCERDTGANGGRPAERWFATN